MKQTTNAVPESAASEQPPPWTVLYVPSKGLLRAEEGDSGRQVWLGLLPDQRAAYEKMIRGVEPLPASALPGVRRAAAPVASADGGDGLPGWLIAAAAAAVVAAGAGALALRRRSGLAPAPPPA